jgi:hypothetical protein
MATPAYLDANSGSLIVSALAAGTAGVGVAGRVAWRRVKGKVTRSGADVEPAATEATGVEEAPTEG